ncbi:hypothetical protein BC834DRAFT_974503 [Gloeopeniophorella convolvens]|nr:hypothetical protein BC834DRAFT_974503 [Gloeopeniophorella convolvens]
MSTTPQPVVSSAVAPTASPGPIEAPLPPAAAAPTPMNQTAAVPSTPIAPETRHEGAAGTGVTPQATVDAPAPFAPASVSSHAHQRVPTPPRGVARVTRSYSALPVDDPNRPRPIAVPPAVVRHRGVSYADSETAWHTQEDRPQRERTVGERLQPTIDSAIAERDRAAQKAKIAGLALNAAIGLQVLIGALTTALGAALSGKSTSVAISILGGSSTIIASYMARTRGSNEPDFSLLRAKALNHFIREIEAFKLDHGHQVGNECDEKINGFRLGLENMLGNQPGSVAIASEAGTGNRSQTGALDPTMTVSMNE